MTATSNPGASAWIVYAILAYSGFLTMIGGVAAPWIMADFGLDPPGTARLFAVISTWVFGSLVLSRTADRRGRRPVLLICLVGAPLFALGAGLARTIPIFAACQILMASCAGAAIVSSVVWISEALPDEHARGQGRGGIAIGLGGGACVAAMPLLEAAGLSWRWLLLLGALGLVGVPLAIRLLPESHPRDGRQAGGGVAITEVFGPSHRRHALALMTGAALVTIALTGANHWRYFHGVTVVGVAPATISILLLVAGAAAFVGFTLGARLCDRVGRVPTVAGFAVLMGIGIAVAYWGPPAAFPMPALWLGLSYFWFAAAANAMTVGGNCTATELFPSRLRGTMAAWFQMAGALAHAASQTTIALLSPVAGGVSPVVGALGLLGLPIAVVYLLLVQETRDLGPAGKARGAT